MITGGASGLGLGMAHALAYAGADIAIVDINLEQAQAAVKTLRYGDRCPQAFQMNVSDAHQVTDVVEEICAKFNQIDVLVNSAGVTILGKPMIEMSEQDWDKIIDINLKGTFLVNQAVARKMMRQQTGRIINVASMSSVIVNRNTYGSSGVYCTSKAGVAMLTKAFAADLAPYNITVNAISPGYMRTPLVEGSWAKDPVGFAAKMDMVPMGIPGDPQDLNGLVVYLASDSSRYMTGMNLVIDGGYSIW
jgi:NAD(P)-dependent dehydrogenase (short-subunit alcohol dehydrogenase family)